MLCQQESIIEAFFIDSQADGLLENSLDVAKQTGLELLATEFCANPFRGLDCLRQGLARLGAVVAL